MRIDRVCILAIILSLGACKNEDLNSGEEFRPRELHDDFQDSHFSRVWVDGVEYLMLERDNNNPHEGFGFMALRGNVILEKQDSTLALLRTIGDFQVRVLAQLQKRPEEAVQVEFMDLYELYLSQERPELERLEKDSLVAR